MAEQRFRRNADGTPATATSDQAINKNTDTSVNRTNGRVDHPAGKQQYMDPEEPQKNQFEEADNSCTVTVSYTIKVISCPDKSRVKNILSARRTPVRTSDDTLPSAVHCATSSPEADTPAQEMCLFPVRAH